MAVIDGSGLVLGRMATAVAERLLHGERITIINAENVVISGNRDGIVERYKKRIDLQQKGNPMKGPKFPKFPDRIVRMAVRGMLPNKRQRTEEALKNLKVYRGVPKDVSADKAEKIEKAENKLVSKFITVGGLCKALGARW